MMGDETIFLTGFPGFIASRLVKRLARDGSKFFLLVQPAFANQARAEVQQIAAQTRTPVENFRLLEGDITVQNLGLGVTDLDLALSESTLIFHLAALYDLGVAREPAMHVNVTGTRNVNQFARSARVLRHYHHVSTWYVAGKRHGRIVETGPTRDMLAAPRHAYTRKLLASIPRMPR